MRKLSIALVLTLAATVASAVAIASAEDFPYGPPPAPGRGGIGPDPIQGNDTGGIIAWAPEIAHVYRDIAAEHCARWNKVSEITSVHRRYGDYVGFRCHFPRGYDPRKGMLFGLPPGH